MAHLAHLEDLAAAGWFGEAARRHHLHVDAEGLLHGWQHPGSLAEMLRWPLKGQKGWKKGWKKSTYQKNVIRMSQVVEEIDRVFSGCGSQVVQISPYPQVQRWEASGCTGDSDAAPYVSIAFGGWQWCYYGLFAFFAAWQ
eukprot:Skav218000  [mRNA]  locus=scaffold2344:67597:68439:- [translate_table: standard]